MTKNNSVPDEQPGRGGVLLNAAVMLGLSVVQRISGLLLITVLARVLTPAGLGAYTLTNSSAQTFWGMFRLGVPAGLHSRLARLDPVLENEEAAELIGESATLIIGMLVFGAAALVALQSSIADHLYGAPELAPFIALAALVFVGQGVAQVTYAAYAGFHAFGAYSRITTILSVILPCTVIAGAMIDGAWGAALGLAIGQLVWALALLGGLVRLFRAFGVKLSFRWPGARARSVLAIGLPFYGSGLFVIPAEFVSLGAVGRFAGVEALGELRVVLALVAVVQVIPQALSGPILSHLAEREGRSAGSGILLALEHMRGTWVFALLTTVGMFMIWPMSVQVIFGDGFPYARSHGQLGLISFIPTLVGTTLTSALMAIGRTMPLLGIGVLQAIVTIGLAWPLVKVAGLDGFFIAQAVAALLASLLWLLSLGRQSGIKLFRKWMPAMLFLTFVVCALIVLDIVIDETWLQRLFASLLLAPAITAAAMYLGYTRKERVQISKRCGLLFLNGREKLMNTLGRRNSSS